MFSFQNTYNLTFLLRNKSHRNAVKHILPFMKAKSISMHNLLLKMYSKTSQRLNKFCFKNILNPFSATFI